MKVRVSELVLPVGGGTPRWLSNAEVLALVE